LIVFHDTYNIRLKVRWDDNFFTHPNLDWNFMVGGKIVRTSFFHGKPSHHYVIIIIIIIIIMFSVQGRLEQLAILVVRARHEQPRTHLLGGLIWFGCSRFWPRTSRIYCFLLRVRPIIWLLVCLPMRSKLEEWLLVPFLHTNVQNLWLLHWLVVALTG
jgi:hypothetical protein